jgi:hypothetical protein
MRHFLLIIALLVIFFLFPLQVFIIGEETGIGFQGAVYRYQITGYGNSLIPITQEAMYIANGIYSGKTALSVILWVLGTIVLTITMWFGLVYSWDNRQDFGNRIGLGLAGSCICYICSCITQYGIFFHGPAGTSIPFGIGIILLWIGIIRFFPDYVSAILEVNAKE